ncbi:MAG: hypothetical protein ACYC4K_10815, partial [Thiobacillus sp.]
RSRKLQPMEMIDYAMKKPVEDMTPDGRCSAIGSLRFEVKRLRPDSELCHRIIEELVRQNNGMTPGWLLDMVPNA